MNKKSILIIVSLLFLVGVVLYAKGWNFSGSPMSSTQLEDTSGTDTDVSSEQSGTTHTAGAAGTRSQTTQQQSILSDVALAGVINNSLITVPQTGVDVALTSGSANFVDSSTKGKVTIDRVLSRVATDDGYDVFVEMTVVIDGRPSVMKYVAVFHNKDQAVAYGSAVLIGDRITLSNITVSQDQTVITKQLSYMLNSGYTATVTYLDRKNGEPFSTAPSLSKTVSLRVKNHLISK